MSTQGHESEAINVSGLKASLKKGGNIGIYNEATCSTAGGTAAKVTNTTPPSFTLTAGAKIVVKFTYAISAENATLQVGSTTAKPIYYKGSALPADIVKAGTSVLLQYDGTSFNIVGDLNTDTTYSTMGASGSTHASGLVPDTPSTAGTTKFLREDGTWQEPAGQNYSAGDGIDISNNEISADNTIARKTDLAPAKLGSGIGTCSTSSGTALVVSLTGYELVQNGFVAVSFEHDVPASATLNINGKGAKPIIYKDSAIEADTIKADDTVTFAYDGTNYVVTSLGGGGAAPVSPNETVNISLAQVGGSSADLIGAAITITNDDTSETILTATWNGSTITAEIEVNTNYTVSVETITGYLACAPQSYQAGYQTERNINFQYRALGTFVEATDGTLYTASIWTSAEKTANAVVVITDACKVRMALTETALRIHSNYTDPLENYITATPNEASAKVDYDGEGNTNKIIQFNAAYGTDTASYAAPYCKAFSFTFPSGQKGCLPSFGQLWTLYQNKTEVDACLAACGGTAMSTSDYTWSSTFIGVINGLRSCWIFRWSNGSVNDNVPTSNLQVRPVSAYE